MMALRISSVAATLAFRTSASSGCSTGVTRATIQYAIRGSRLRRPAADPAHRLEYRASDGPPGDRADAAPPAGARSTAVRAGARGRIARTARGDRRGARGVGDRRLGVRA